MKILLCGGGTLGPVVPLLAVLRKMRVLRPDATFVWAGTPDGPERALVEKEYVPFCAIPVAKIPRYLTLRLAQWPFAYARARWAAEKLIAREQPDLVVSVGGFTSVPVIRAASKKGIPCAIHQLDFLPGLSNRAVARMCKSVTSSFRYEKPAFGWFVKCEQIPTPCRFGNIEVANAGKGRPVVLILGGGTGARAINESIDRCVDTLLPLANVIHSTGAGKIESRQNRPGYTVMESLNESSMLESYSAADVVVSRGGMGTLSELAALRKAAIVIPMPETHQEKNASALLEGIVIVRQDAKAAKNMEQAILSLLKDPARRAALGEKLHELLPTDDGSALAEKWLNLVK